MKRKVTFPLFWRIFFSIWLAMAVTVVASNIATRVLLDRERQAIERQTGLLDVAREAVEIRESPERGSVWRFLKSEGERLDLHLMLLAKGKHDGRLPSHIRERMDAGWYQQKPAVLDVDEKYRLVAWPRTQGEGWLDPRFFRTIELGLAFVMISLACWWIARRVSRPLRHMESTAQAISQGANSLRVSEHIARRRDEVGLLATAFNNMTEQLCNLLERQKHLLRDISHDLRTPLARQRVAIELASESGADEELMASILRQNERLETMTGQILTLYRVTDAGGDISREALRPVQVINRVLQDAADYAEHQGVDCKLVVSPDASGASVLGDEGLLGRALDNILQNALDHTPPGKAVHLGLTVSEGWLSLTVDDEGPGVSEESIGHLFEPFFRADKSRGGQGWGLGLAIARDIVRSHDGDIAAETGDRGGLRIRIHLPVFFGGG
ncbi:sensor histidine kinase [Marinobacter sp. F3R08]|uniref:sensor histidine kinase n=1 Tax=Marinobacter sp. F3R08 TaxID=2841559 RepID=UPI001C08F1E5|nr:HAMP domain-containing sensor histidine kinase [Marinobacter sp. F3R08]MBU2953870.1 HAMP domain-containing histidine kinase [Marinobacter sp. F3R08]